MKLVHYTTEPLTEIYPGTQSDTDRMKPKGLWLSDDDEEPNWKSWCFSEGFNTESFKLAYEIELKPKHGVLILEKEAEIVDFSNLFQIDGERFQLDWERVAVNWRGLIITPYHWGLRLDINHMWYYGWDCASGCIWDPEAIKSFKEIPVDAQ